MARNILLEHYRGKRRDGERARCDLGLVENSNTGPGGCTRECKLAKCGDGLIWAGKEACDNGPNNNEL